MRLSLPTLHPNLKTRLVVDQYLRRLPDAVVGRHYGDALFHPAPGWWRYSLGPYLTAIADFDLQPTSVLDVGSGDGLITCFYAFLYPDADVIALDLCGLCLVTTRTIAARLGLPNLHIVQGDAVDAQSLFLGKHFDLVLARALTVFRGQCSCGRALAAAPGDLHPIAKVTRILEAIRHVLTPTGLFISTEHWAGAAGLWSWASQVTSAGLSIDWSRSPQIPTAGRRWTMLLSQVASTPTRISLGDVLALLVNAEIQHTGRPPPLTGYVAEALFNSLTPISFIFGFQATRYDVILRRELYSVGALVVSYDYTNSSERELRLWPKRIGSSPQVSTRCRGQ